MRMYGEFLDRLGRTVAVEVVSSGVALGTGAASADVVVGEDGVYFPGSEAVTIESDVTDGWDVVRTSRARVKIQSDRYLGGLFVSGAPDGRVTVWRDGEVLFAGVLEPRAYSQSFGSAADELELTCPDCLAALEYSNYKGVGNAGVDYAALRSASGTVTLLALLREALRGVRREGSRLWYDGSVGGASVFSDLSLSELLVLGDDEEDVWTCREVVEEIAGYLGLCVEQRGFDFYFFRRRTLKERGSVTWTDIEGGTVKTEARPSALALSEQVVWGDGASLTMGDVYNRVLLTCETKDIEDIVSAPLDSDHLEGVYSGMQLYATEYWAKGSGETARKSMRDLITCRSSGYDGAGMTDWYVRVWKASGWRFPYRGGSGDRVSELTAGGTHQQCVPDDLTTHIGAALLSFGKNTVEGDTTADNSPVSSVSMTECLWVSVNGNGDTTEGGASPTDAALLASCPVAVYEGAEAGGSLSPADSGTTNYVLLRGKVALVPRVVTSGDIADMRTTPVSQWWVTDDGGRGQFYGHWAFPPVGGRDGDRFYTAEWYAYRTPQVGGIQDSTGYVAPFSPRLIPFGDKCPQDLEFKYSAIGDGGDHVSKVAVLACMLIVGGKCVVEKPGGQGNVDDFEWRAFKERSACASDDEYFAQSFTIGFDPKIGDKLIGTKFDIQDNTRLYMGLEDKGTAIPVRASDRVSGRVRFMILGPVNTVWDEVTKRHRTWFRHTSWSSTSKMLLPLVEGVQVEGFEVTLVTDGGKDDRLKDEDIVYVSDTDERFVNVKDDLTHRIHSALTASEASELGVRSDPSLSVPVLTADGSAVTAVGGEKPERRVVSESYEEWHLPRVTLEQCVDDEGVSPLRHYTHPALAGKDFYVERIERDIQAAEATLTIKENEIDG